VNGYDRASAILVAQEAIAALDAENVKTGLSEGGNQARIPALSGSRVNHPESTRVRDAEVTNVGFPFFVA
jgi:hypothetical protein